MVLEGPGGFRKVREAGRNNSLLFSSKFDVIVPSYEQKTPKVLAVLGLPGVGFGRKLDGIKLTPSRTFLSSPEP